MSMKYYFECTNVQYTSSNGGNHSVLGPKPVTVSVGDVLDDGSSTYHTALTWRLVSDR